MGLKIGVAIFDMDGTLVDSLMVWDVLWATLGERYRKDPLFLPSAEDDKAVRTLPLKEAMQLIHENYRLGESGGELLDAANKLIYEFYAGSVEMKRGAREFLEYCKASGVKMCIASATAPELIDIAMKHCGIEGYFSKIFSCGTLGKGKDAPDVFLLAGEYLGERVEDTWVFEDSLVAIETASKIGMKTVGIYDRYNYGQDRIREIADVYVADGETLMKLVQA